MTAVTGPLAALLTPRTDSGGIDIEALERNVEFVLERGIRGVVPCGGTGEYFDLSVAQRKEAVERVAARLEGRGLLIPGIGAGTVGESIELGHHALDSGADAVLLPAPLFYRYDGRDLIGFYRQAARAIGGPLLIYNLAAFVSPVPNDVAIELIETEENIVGVKDSSGSLELLEALTKRGDATTVRILGHDAVLGDAVRGGLIDAVISGPASVIPEATAALFELAGNKESFEQAAVLYGEFVRHNEQLPYPWGLKQIAEARGLFKARLPFEPSDDRRQQIGEYMCWFEEWLERVQQCRSAAKLN
jgi:4-hydroxy-tetrahydrodipicolinate synthase